MYGSYGQYNISTSGEYITKKVKIVSPVRDTPNGPPLITCKKCKMQYVGQTHHNKYESNPLKNKGKM